MRAHTRLTPLTLRHPFGLSRSTATRLPTVLFRLGDVGLGEAPPVRYLGHSPERACELLTQLAAGVDEGNLLDRDHHFARALRLAPEHSSARAALDIALWDAAARRRGLPLHALLAERGHAAAPPKAAVTSYTIALDALEAMETRAREVAHLPALKLKLGRSPEFDVEITRRVRAAAPDASLRVDINGGWRPADAPGLCARMADLGVEFIEQPLPIGALDETAALRRQSPLPLYADEDALDDAALPALRARDAVDGINIKLSKCGGITGALRMIEFARECGWRILIGCMIETRVGLSAAAQLAGLVDHLDLDAHLLTVDDPVAPGSVDPQMTDARLPLVEGPGVGPALESVAPVALG